MEISKCIKYLEKRDVAIFSYGKYMFCTAKGWHNAKDFKNYNDLKTFLEGFDL